MSLVELGGPLNELIKGLLSFCSLIYGLRVVNTVLKVEGGGSWRVHNVIVWIPLAMIRNFVACLKMKTEITLILPLHAMNITGLVN